jgi:hypothetical protein
LSGLAENYPPLAVCSGLLGRHFNSGVEINLPGPTTWRDRTVAGSRHWKSIFAKSTHMKLDCTLDPAQGAVNGLPSGDASRKIRNGRTPVAAWIAIDANEILGLFHGFDAFKPA